MATKVTMVIAAIAVIAVAGVGIWALAGTADD